MELENKNILAMILARDGLLNQGRIIQDNTIGVPMEQPEVNIDESLDLSWAESIL